MKTYQQVAQEIEDTLAAIQKEKAADDKIKIQALTAAIDKVLRSVNGGEHVV